MNLIEKWQRWRSYFVRQHRPHKCRRPLVLETLEERAVPTVIWGSAGSRTVADAGGPVLTQVDVDLVFWGAGWNSAQALMNNVISSVTTIMNSPFLSGLSQYRGVGNGQLLRTDLIASSSPSSTFTNGQVQNMLTANINSGVLPPPSSDSQLLYMVITQPGSSAGGTLGEHYWAMLNGTTYHYGWTTNNGSLDAITRVFSHELTESVTDPEANLNTAFYVPETNDEICDPPAQNYTYRLDGVLVQSSLSQADQAYDVYDGNTQKLFLTSTKALTINGGQLDNPDDTITLDVAAGGYTINLNGELFQFDPGQISSITINTLSGNDTVNIEGTIAGASVTVNLGSGSNTVNLSPTAQSLNRLAGAVTINGGPGTGALNLFDQASNTDQNYTVTSSAVTGTDLASVTYQGLAAITLNTSNGTDTISVPSSLAGTAVAINGGSGTDTLVGSAAANTWNLTGSNTGTLSSASIAGPVSFTAVQNLTGGAANNTFVFSDGAGISGNLDGGSGGSLDYSAYSSNVLVNLQTATATGVGGSIAHIQNVSGGAGGGAGIYNILVGNGGNTLIGGDGRRNLLIAGASPSTLQGGSDDDLLIGGTTAYDQNPDALVAIMDYWSGTSDDYATRVSNLFSGNGVPLLDPSTVTSNGGSNTLIGGVGLNLYYGNSSDTTDFDPNSGAVFVFV
jgi:hypothetical protein